MIRKKIEKIGIAKKFNVPYGATYLPQSLAYISDNDLIIACSDKNHKKTINNFMRVLSTSTTIKIPNVVSAKHASGCTYCDKNGYIYVSDLGQVRVLDAKTLKLKFTIHVSKGATGIAYDRITNMFYISSSGGTVRVYPFSSFSKAGTVSGSESKFSFKTGARSVQDIGGYNGVVLATNARGGTKQGETVYLDCYDAATGKLLISYSTTGELESMAVDNNGFMYLLYVKSRRLIKTTNRLTVKGSLGSDSATSQFYTSVSSEIDYRNEVIAKAESYKNRNGVPFWSYGDLAKGQPWCACFIWCIYDMVGLSEYCYPKGCYSVTRCKAYMEEHPDVFTEIYSKSQGSLSNVAPGDFVIYDFEGDGELDHIGLVKEPIDDSKIRTIEGNTSGGIVAERTREKKIIIAIFRSLKSGNTFFASPERLYSSENYSYIDRNDTEDYYASYASETSVKLKNAIQQWSTNSVSPIPDTAIVNSIVVPTAFDDRRLKQTKIEGAISGPALPIALDPVEAPFIELTIGEHTFGTADYINRYDIYPNYINSMNVTKTNGSMNEYTINLIHQIRPGSNPNFIDELISKNGYNKITIKYGDANSNVVFIDSNALLIGVDESFDFINCNISYTIKATSSAVSIASHKRVFTSIQDKPSNIIRNLLYNDASEDLLNAFPMMRDKNFVEKNNLIPTNDVVVDVEEYKNINVVSYLKNLVSIMKSSADEINRSTYMLTIQDGYFNISEISNNYIYDASLYEVNINFPDDNQVFSFNVDTNYTWPIAYNYSGNVSNYNYEINNYGQINSYRTNSSNLLNYSSQAETNLNDNWWKQVNEFPISAKLTCRGLLSPLLLLTYIKINCLYYGKDRTTSGVYIVTGQQDSLSGSGYQTTLSLLKVAGNNQYINIDGRVRT